MNIIGGEKMKYKFVSMNKKHAREMINNWKYEGEYSVYDYCNEEESLLEEESWGFGKFAALDENNNLIGELTIEFFEEVDESSEDDGYVDIKTVKDNPNKIYEMWIGFGLRPDLTGQGLGSEYVSECVDFAVNHHNYKGDYVRLGVAEFNKRAIKSYKKADFKQFNTYEGEIAGKKFKILWMRKALRARKE